MWVCTKRIIDVDLREPHRRQVDEIIDSFEDRPESFQGNGLDRDAPQVRFLSALAPCEMVGGS